MSKSTDEQERSFVQPLALLVGLMVIVALVVLVAHGSSLSAQALSFDDDQYLTGNPFVQNPSWWAAGQFLTEILNPSMVGGYYQPLSMISLMLDHARGGSVDNLRPFHQTSLALHVCNTLLVVVLLYLLFDQPWVAAMVGLLFGVHPMTVEPIPWVGERKTLLAAFFALGSLVAYVRYARRGGWVSYMMCLVMFVLALMSKPTSTTLPVCMLLLDWWPLRRLRWRSLLEKVPFFVIAGVSGIITVISQGRTASVEMPTQGAMTDIPLTLCHNIFFYLYKIVLPVNLSSHYPFPEPMSLSNPALLVGVIGICLLIPALFISLRWTRAWLVGWLIFFVAIFPTMGVIGFTVVIASDKFAYLPSVGLLIALAWFLRQWWAGDWLTLDNVTFWFGLAGLVVGLVAGLRRARRIGLVVVVVILAAMELRATQRYLMVWQDTETLRRYMVELAPHSPTALNSLGLALAKSAKELGLVSAQNPKVDQALEYYRRALEVNPGYSHAHHNLANLLYDLGKNDEAIAHFRAAVALDPDLYPSHNGLGLALTRRGETDEAIQHFREALRIKPRYTISHNNLACALLERGEVDEAIRHFREALEIAPSYHDARYNLASALLQQGKIAEACQQYALILQMNPSDYRAYNRLGNIMLRQGRNDEAIQHFSQVLRINPDDLDAHINIGVALIAKKEWDQAITHYRQLVQRYPGALFARYNLAGALVERGNLDEAIAQYETILQAKPDLAMAHAQLGSARASRGNVGEAVKAYRSALQFEPANADWRCDLGDLLKRQNKLDEAIEEYHKALAIQPEHQKARDGLADVSVKKGG